MPLYYYVLDENTIITHDGYLQLGLFLMNEETFLSSVKVNYQKVYWIPDTFSKRYKRVNFQNHLRAASIGTKD